MQSLIASLICILLGLLIGYIVLLIINPAGAGKAITTVIKNFLTYKKPETPIKYFGNTLVKTAPLLMCALSILFAYKVGLFNIGAAGQYVAGTCACIYAALAWHCRGGCRMLLAIAAGACSARSGPAQGLLQRQRGHLRHYAQLDRPVRREHGSDEREGGDKPLYAQIEGFTASRHPLPSGASISSSAATKYITLAIPMAILIAVLAPHRARKDALRL